MLATTLYKHSIKSVLQMNQARNSLKVLRQHIRRNTVCYRSLSDQFPSSGAKGSQIINDKVYTVDSWTNVTPRILSLMNRNLHNQKNHPLELIKKKIVNYMYSKYPGPRGPLFSVHDQVSCSTSNSIIIRKTIIKLTKKDKSSCICSSFTA